jgi:hypothetical protein
MGFLFLLYLLRSHSCIMILRSTIFVLAGLRDCFYLYYFAVHFYLRCHHVNILPRSLPNYGAAHSSLVSTIILHKYRPSLARRQMKTCQHALYFLFFLCVPSTGLNYLPSSCLHSFSTGPFLHAAYAGLRLITKRAIACCSCN